MLNITYSIADQSFLRTKSLGILNLSAGLLEHLRNRSEIDSLHVLANSSLITAGYVPNGCKTSVHNISENKFGRIAWDQVGLYQAAAASGNEWLLLPKGFASFVKKPPVRVATYMHDAMADVYCRQYRRETSLLENWYFRLCTGASLKHSSVIFTNSEFTRSEILRMAHEMNIKEPHVITAGIGFSQDQWQDTDASDTLRRQGIVVPVGRWAHKISDKAIAWLKEWQHRENWAEDVHIVGTPPDGTVRPVLPRWHWHDRLPDSEYRKLICGSRLLVFFSEYEGFGMPPVEATLAGACPVYSNIPATREAMLGCGVAFDNDDYDSFAGAMNTGIDTAQDVIEGWTQQLLACHNWNAVCTRILDGLKECPPLGEQLGR